MSSHFSYLKTGDEQLRDFVSNYYASYSSSVATASKIPTSMSSILSTRQPSPPISFQRDDLKTVSALSGAELPKSDFLTLEPDEEYILPSDESTPWNDVLMPYQPQATEDLPEVQGSPDLKANARLQSESLRFDPGIFGCFQSRALLTYHLSIWLWINRSGKCRKIRDGHDQLLLKSNKSFVENLISCKRSR